MNKALVADDNPSMRMLIKDILSREGFEIIEAGNGDVAYAISVSEKPDIILLDVMMPVMDGFEVLRRLRENPLTEAIPVILLTAVPPVKGERAGMKLGVEHYIPEPFDSATLMSAVRVALREAAAKDVEEPSDTAPLEWQSWEFQGGKSSAPVSPGVIRAGNKSLNEKLGGGIPVGSLTLIVGTSSAGKSVLSQHFTYESLLGGQKVAYFTSENTSSSLISQMGSIGLGVSSYFKDNNLAILPIEELISNSDPEQSMASLGQVIEHHSSQYSVLILDAITDLVSYSEDKTIVAFFSGLKRLCNDKTTIFVVGHSHAFDEKILTRLRDLCDAYLSLRVEKIGVKLTRILEIAKVHNAEMSVGNLVGFEVVEGTGIRIVPGVKTRI